MPIPQIARNPDIQPEELLNHAQAIGATVDRMGGATDRILKTTLAISSIGSELLQTLQAHRDQGRTVVDSTQKNGRKVFVEPAIEALESSFDTLIHAAKDFNSQAQAYEKRLNFHNRTMTANLTGIPLQAKVFECEKKAIRIMNQQKITLQRNLPAIQVAEEAVVDLHNMLTEEIICMELLPAAQDLDRWL